MSVVNTPEHSDNTTLRGQSVPQSPPLTPLASAGDRAFPPDGRITLDRATRLIPGSAGSNAPSAPNTDSEASGFGNSATGRSSGAGNRGAGNHRGGNRGTRNRGAGNTTRIDTAAGDSEDRLNPPGDSSEPMALGAAGASATRTSATQASTVLMGGSPLRLMKLTGASETVTHLLAGGATVREAAAAAKTSIRSVARLADRLIDAQLAHPLWGPTPSTQSGLANVEGESSPNVPDAPQVRDIPTVPTAQDLSTVTLVIPVKNRQLQLRRLLNSLQREIGEGLNVVVVDDGSTDTSGNVAREFGAQVLRNEQSLGPAAARNRGLDTVVTPFVAFVDSDCTCAYGWLPLLLQHFADPSVALVAPRIFGNPPVQAPLPLTLSPLAPSPLTPSALTASALTASALTASGLTASELTAFGTSFVETSSVAPSRVPNLDLTKLALVEPSPVIGSHPSSALEAYEAVRSPLDLGPEQALIVPRTRVSYVPSAALLARTNVLRALSGFSSELQVGEDVDLLWRLHAAGWRSRYEPRATVAHDHRVSWDAFTQRRYQYGTSAALLDARHPGQVAPLAVSGWSALGWLGLCTLSPVGVVGGLGIMAATTALLPRKLFVVANPRRLALDLAGRGHFGAGRQLASATWRAYLPIVLLSALIPKPIGVVGRRILLASAIVPNVADWRSKHPKLDPIRYVGIRLLDDAAYCAGVWSGAFKLRSFRSLKPDFTSWPGKGRNGG
jgi:mycofactocin system glycosyltransferase